MKGIDHGGSPVQIRPPLLGRSATTSPPDHGMANTFFAQYRIVLLIPRVSLKVAELHGEYRKKNS